jgi:hypothetical protein
MKKLLLFIFLLVSTVSVIAQTKIQTYKNQTGRWIPAINDYSFEYPDYQSITFTFYENVILTNDNAKSVYRIAGESIKKTDKDYKTLSFVCLDEQNRSCYFTLMTHFKTNSIVISIIYNNAVLIYYSK